MSDDVFNKLTEKMKSPNSKYLLSILRKTITPEEGELLLELPAPSAELAKKLHKKEGVIINNIASLLKRGLLMESSQGLTLARDPISLHDTSLSTFPELSDPEVNKIWKEWYETEWSKEASTRWIGTEGPLIRLIPTTKSLNYFTRNSSAEIFPYEDPQKIIQMAKVLAVGDCPCRRMMANCDHPLDVCLYLDDRAEFALSRPSARKLSVDEALAVLDLSEELGLVNFVFNKISPLLSMCHCCSEACVPINSAMKYGTLYKQLAKTRFQAEVNEDACTGCQLCLRRCQFGAITMETIPGTKKKLKAHIDIEKCWGCGQCIQKCKPQAISLKLIRPSTYIPSGKTQDSETSMM